MSKFDEHKSYQAVPNPVQSDKAQDPSSKDLNPLGSTYAEDYGKEETLLIKQAIQEEIFDATPEQYKALRLLFEKPVRYVGNDEFTYLEKTFGRNALVSNDTEASAAEQTITMKNSAGDHVTPGKILVYPNNRKGIVKEVDGNDVTVVKYNNTSDLPEVSDGDVFAIGGTVIADGMNFLMHYDRMKKIERYNFIQLMHRDKRWTRMQMRKFANQGTTEYFDKDKQEQMDYLLQDMFSVFWNGERGEVDIHVPGNLSEIYKAKVMGGIYPLMQSAGSSEADSVTKAALQPTFEELAFETNYKAEGAVRYVFAVDHLLYELSKAFKEPGIRYTPNDRVADLNLYEYRLGTMRFVPIATELFKEESMFPASWKNKIFVIDSDTIQPVCMTGYMPIEMGETNMKGESGSIKDYKEWWIQGMLSLQMNNPLSSFIINTENIV